MSLSRPNTRRRFVCPQCKKAYALKDPSIVGKRVKCASCGHAFEVKMPRPATQRSVAPVQAEIVEAPPAQPAATRMPWWAWTLIGLGTFSVLCCGGLGLLGVFVADETPDDSSSTSDGDTSSRGNSSNNADPENAPSSDSPRNLPGSATVVTSTTGNEYISVYNRSKTTLTGLTITLNGEYQYTMPTDSIDAESSVTFVAKYFRKSNGEQYPGVSVVGVSSLTLEGKEGRIHITKLTFGN